MNGHGSDWGAPERLSPDNLAEWLRRARESGGVVSSDVVGALVGHLRSVEAERDGLRADLERTHAVALARMVEIEELRRELSAVHRRLVEAKSYLLAEEERRKLTGDALWAEGELARVEAERDALHETARALLESLGGRLPRCMGCDRVAEAEDDGERFCLVCLGAWDDEGPLLPHAAALRDLARLVPP